MRIALLAVALLPIAAMSGCASIVDGSNQSLSVKSIADGKDISGANCTLTSNKGTWYVTTPGSVTVHRGYDDLNVKCTKAGYQVTVENIKSSTKPMAFGNILFGGVIGAGVDMKTGAAYDYPNLITVSMTPDSASTATIAPNATVVAVSKTPSGSQTGTAAIGQSKQ